MNKRVAITGVGCIKPTQIKDNKFLVANEQIPKTIEFSHWRKMDRYCKMGILAAKLAIESACDIVYEKDDVAIVVGTAWGAANSILQYGSIIKEQGCSMASPNLFPLTINNSMGGFLSIFFGYRGPNVTLTTGKAASCDAIGYAFRLIKNGEAKCVLVGGVEEFSNPREAASKVRNLKPIGEGSAFLVLEDMDNAISRDSVIRGEVLNYFSLSGKRSEMRAVEKLLIEGFDQDNTSIQIGNNSLVRNEIGDLEGANTVFDLMYAFENKKSFSNKNAFLYTDYGRTSVLVLKFI